MQNVDRLEEWRLKEMQEEHERECERQDEAAAAA
jgi:hypothetical protein